MHGVSLECVLLLVEAESNDMREGAITQHPKTVDCNVQDWITSLSHAIPNAAQVTHATLRL